MLRPKNRICGAGLGSDLGNYQTIRLFMLLCFAVVTLASPVSAYASEDPSAGPKTEGDDKGHLTRNFAELYLPAEISIAGALDNFERQFSRTLESEPSNAALEKKYPGIGKAAMSAGRAVLRDGLQKDIPTIQLELSAYMGENFSAPEIRAINQFYTSSAGRSLLRGVRENLDADQLTDRMIEKMKTGDGQMVIDNDEIIDMTGQAAMKSLEEEHIPAIAAFMTSPAGRKFSLHAKDLIAIVSQGMNVSTNRMMPDIQAAGLRASIAFAAGKQ
ncbi:hypothetical protein CHN51_06425 [Sphingorhabdus sp. YGSMI21]|nr:hypothetical protein CHN51_06425 [Sphingorhabdus sp. YGSMI21]